MIDRNLDHDRALYAYKCVEEIKNIGVKAEKSYRSAVLSSGALIQKSGLMQTLAFYLSKKSDDKEYLFRLDNISGKDSKDFLKRLQTNHEIGWAESAKISESGDKKTIHIVKDKNSAEIVIDETEGKATLRISDGRTHELILKTKNGKLNICDKNYSSNYEWIAGHILYWKGMCGKTEKHLLDTYKKLLDCSDEGEMVYKTQEAKALMVWLKRFAETMLEKGED